MLSVLFVPFVIYGFDGETDTFLATTDGIGMVPNRRALLWFWLLDAATLPELAGRDPVDFGDKGGDVLSCEVDFLRIGNF